MPWEGRSPGKSDHHMKVSGIERALSSYEGLRNRASIILGAHCTLWAQMHAAICQESLVVARTQVMGAAPLQQRGEKGKSGAAGLQVKEYVRSGYGPEEANSPPGLSSAQPSLSGFCSSTSAYSNPVFCTPCLVTRLPMWKTRLFCS